MRPRRLLFIACTLSLALLAACGGGGGGGGGGPKATDTPEASPTPAGTTVASDDGKLSLFVPEGAMPEGTDVSIISVPHDQLPVELSQLVGSGTGYGLEPDGLEFSQPATATLTLDRSELDDAEGTQSAYALVSFNSTAGREVLDSDTAATTGGDEISVTAQIQHFSTISRTKGSLMVSLDTVPRGQVVGAQWNGKGTVSNANAGVVELVNGLVDWFASGRVAFIMAPGQVALQPIAGTAAFPGRVDLALVPLTCTAPGLGAFGYRATVDSQVVGSPNLVTRLRLSIDQTIECLTPADATATALAPTATEPSLLPEDYKISQVPRCRHNRPGDSDHLDDVGVADAPGNPVANAQVALQVEGPGLLSPSGERVASLTSETTTNAEGIASFESPINAFGEYISTVLGVTLADGSAAPLDPASMLVASYTVGATC